VVAKAKVNLQQTILERGYHIVDDTRIWETPLKIEFNLVKNVLEYNVREKVGELIELMKTVDATLKIKSVINNKSEWIDKEEIPEDQEFNDNFQLKEFNYRTHRKVIV